MRGEGIKEFQIKRHDILIYCVNKSSLTLLEKGINVSPTTIIQEIAKIFKEENINTKYLVTAQTIGRNEKYNSIWKKFKKKQKKTFLTKHEKKNKELEFSIRDKYDMLKQDYIELNDEYSYLVKENNQNIKKIDSLRQNDLKNNFNTVKNYKNDSSVNFLISLKKLLTTGSIVIVEKDDCIVIKNLNQKDDNKITIDKNEWQKL